MNAVDAKDVTEILGNTRDWAPAKRLALAQRLLDTLETDVASTRPPRKPLEGLVGLLKTDAPPPSDEECDRIRFEELMKKHG